MTLVKNKNYFLSLLLNKIGLKIMFPDHPVREQAYLDWKIRILPSCPMQMFFKGVNPWLWSKIEIIFFSLLLNNIALKIMFGDHPVRKQVYLDWKIRILPSRPMQMFFKGVNPWLWSKIEIIFFACF